MINAEKLKNAIISAAESIGEHTNEINKINVFPVPDGDTGTNLAATLSGCIKAVETCKQKNAGALAQCIADALIRSARGNSGVIFSMIFKGFAESVKELESIDALSLANGIEAGCNEAYSAVEKPAEGTMLTVIRLAAAKAVCAAKKGKSAEETFAAAVSGARASLITTVNLLPVLKKHGVVDAGGKGLVLIMEAMLDSSHKLIQTDLSENSSVSVQADIRYIYCTEFLINKPNISDTSEFRSYLSQIGDCSAVIGNPGIIKVHVHTNRPDMAISKALLIGELSNIKIENMRYQSVQC